MRGTEESHAEEEPKKAPLGVQDVLKRLFAAAEESGGLDYIFTLLRVTGLSRSKDPLSELEAILNDEKAQFPPKDPTAHACLRNGIEESLGILGNLLHCSVGAAYKYRVFRSLYRGSFPNIVKPSVEQMSKELQDLAAQRKNPAVADLLANSSLTTLITDEPSKGAEEQVSAKSFLKDLIAVYKSERLKFRDRPPLYKLPRFEVLELMVNEVEGLYGFCLHFSNGSSAHFVRSPDSTDAVNLHFDRQSELVPFVGDLDALTEEWRVGDKRLYEIGLPGRYNKLGEWKPLVYPQRKSDIIDRLQQRANGLCTDEEVRGVLLYVMCSGHQVIEFVVKADIQLPWQDTDFGDRLHLWKCPSVPMTQGLFIYDGTYRLSSLGTEEIETAIAAIGLTLNTIGFAYDATLRWRLKYRAVNGPGVSVAKIEEADLDVLRLILERYPQNKDGLVLNSAIDWHSRGLAARDVFARFLCYYRAIETIVASVYRSTASFGLGFKKCAKDEAKQKSLDCIERKFDELYATDKRRFVTSAYAECIQGARTRTEDVLGLVFGQDSRYIRDLFESAEGERQPSLYQIRSRIAHGNLRLLEKEDVKLVRRRVADIETISKELIMRLLCALKSSDDLPTWSEMRTVALSGYDPRTWLVTNMETVFPKDVDWRIRPEWCS